MNRTINVEPARERDLNSMIKIDSSTIGNKSRLGFILESVQKGECLICKINGNPVGYAIVNKAFFGQTFIWLLVTSKDFRRKGVATSLIRHIESNCGTEKLFTSTNQSNKRMQNLMDKLGFSKSGYLENLDRGDPEIFYFKRIDSYHQSGFTL